MPGRKKRRSVAAMVMVLCQDCGPQMPPWQRAPEGQSPSTVQTCCGGRLLWSTETSMRVSLGSSLSLSGSHSPSPSRSQAQEVISSPPSALVW